MMHGYLKKETNEWRLAILNGVHNNKMKAKLESHILTDRLKEDDKKLVGDLTKSLVHPKHIILNLKSKRKYSFTNIKQMFNACQRCIMSTRTDKLEWKFGHMFWGTQICSFH